MKVDVTLGFCPHFSSILVHIITSVVSSVQVLLLEKEQQHLDKTQNWRRKIDPLMIWISSAENRVNTQFEIAPDLDTVKKQKNDLEVNSNFSLFFENNSNKEKTVSKFICLRVNSMVLMTVRIQIKEYSGLILLNHYHLLVNIIFKILKTQRKTSLNICKINLWID